MKKIAVVTATRAEYGLLSPVIRELRKHEGKDLAVEVLVTGTHLSDRYGRTIREIESDGIRIDETIPVSVHSDTEMDISQNQAEILVKFTALFARKKYNAVLLLGDRYETLAIAVAAGNTRTPIFHISGGDTTEGALDEWIRHAVTKISYLHFTTNEVSRKRVVQMGEDPSRVFNFGSTSIDNILTSATMTREEALESVGLTDCKFALCTYHPVTMEGGGVDMQVQAFLEAIKAFPELQFIVTKSNADQGGARINELLDEAEPQIDNLHVFASLGVKRYLSLMKHAEFVLGNSSSGIVETPAFHIPTVNIGDRQRGRLQAKSVINCDPSWQSILQAIALALSQPFRDACLAASSPYGDGRAAERIAMKSIEAVNGAIDLKKKFYDMEFQL